MTVPTPTSSTSVDVRIAAIDIGSNSVRQIVADVSPLGQIRVIDEMKAMPRLGEGVESTGALNATAVETAVAAVHRMVMLARQLGAARIEIVATSAVRDASNSADFTQQVEALAGQPVRILSGEEEALLCFRSALAHFELGAGRTVIMDIGGGSLELVLSKDGLIERMASLPFGAVRMTEKFLQPAIRPRRVNALREFVRKGLKEAVPVKDWRGAQVIGSGGTFTNLAGIMLSRNSVAAPGTHGTRVTRAELEHVLLWLQQLTSDERKFVPGLNPARAYIILAGLAVAAEVLKRFDPRDLLTSAYGIREGLLLEAARVTPTAVDPGVARDRSVREFAERCHYEEPHARQVQRLALQLFDALAGRLGLTPPDRRILSDAALLHDVGYHINYEKHHKHSFHLISHADLLGMTPAEQIMIAHIARYHRGAPPKIKHEGFGELDRLSRERIITLSALLRFADGLDRGHVAAVGSLEIKWEKDAMRVFVREAEGATNVRLECWGGSRKRQLLESVLDRPIIVVLPDGTELTTNDDGEGE